MERFGKARSPPSHRFSSLFEGGAGTRNPPKGDELVQTQLFSGHTFEPHLVEPRCAARCRVIMGDVSVISNSEGQAVMEREWHPYIPNSAGPWQPLYSSAPILDSLFDHPHSSVTQELNDGFCEDFVLQKVPESLHSSLALLVSALQRLQPVGRCFSEWVYICASVCAHVSNECSAVEVRLLFRETARNCLIRQTIGGGITGNESKMTRKGSPNDRG